MKELIIEKIDSLPPLPKSVLELEKFRKLPNKDPRELRSIIEKDPLMITTILRVANSAMFAFKDKVETPSRAISLLGTNFCISIALGSVVQNLIKSNLEAYDATTDDFLFISNLSSMLINAWISSVDEGLKDELMLAAFLQEIGKFIISDLIVENNLIQEFQDKLKENDIENVEKEFMGFSCSRITANIFKHWNLSPNLIFTIGFVNDLDSCPKEFIKKAQILQIVKILCDITEPLSDGTIKRAIAKAIEYNFDIEPLVNAIDSLKVKISKEP
ncbi:HDOD domain-containing protein [Malaciobacter mytili]|uniref:HDOD domain-containing protein n=1 Tax=Malaciobacter mytili LMG 24559 TaxID=1032238 RepID=A0AAX2AET2_9BACT|nr:HDOD domain-containing protein [Malaciobacter mytili]AXH13785.1 HDOD domain-containing protein [Malaciobacter mytili LMG 24559]RXK12927.1 HDOD domain-containing protein [Malaciobacter mytili LMG 24559]